MRRTKSNFQKQTKENMTSETFQTHHDIPVWIKGPNVQEKHLMTVVTSCVVELALVAEKAYLWPKERTHMQEW